MATSAPTTATTGYRYTATGELGRGGWGVVERAKDEQLDRDVAIKRVHGEFVDNGSIRDRFCNEARVTASLQHPGIAAVHELGIGDDGAPYYVMKLLEGPTLKQVIEEAGVASQRSVDGYSIELLERFVDICNTVSYAHQQQVIHRDLKPSNILVGKFGETVVVDWGLAKRLGESNLKPTAAAIEATLAPGSGSQKSSVPGNKVDTRRMASACASTRHGAVLGTPAYMSPEQSRGETESLTIATDIYALGVILYEMLTGENPFRTDSVETTISRVQQGDYVPPRQINGRVPKQLAAICTTAMARDPADRYASAEEIVDDIRSFLAGEPVSVCPDSLGAKLDRWRRRRPGLTAGLISAAAVLLVASVGYGVVIQNAHRAERAARIAAEQAQQDALRKLTVARQAGDAWLIDLSSSLEFFPGMDSLRHNLLEQALAHYTDLAAGVADQGKLNSGRSLEAARCQLRIGDLHRLLGDLDLAKAAYLLAEQQADEALLTESPDADDLRMEQVNAHIGLVLAGEQRDLLDDKQWLSEQSAAGDPSRQLDAANAAARMAIAQSRAGLLSGAEAIEQLQAAEANVVTLVAQRAAPRDHQLLQTLRDELTLRLREQCWLAEASKVWAEEVARLDTQIASQPTRPDLLQARAFARMRMAGLDTRRRRVPQATAGYQGAIDDLREAWRLSDADAYYHRNVAISLANLGQASSDPKSAEQQLQQAIGELGKAVQQTGPTADDLQRLAVCEAALGGLAALRRDPQTLTHFDAAERCYELLIEHDQLTPPHALSRCEALVDRALYQIDIGDEANAGVDLDRADALLQEVGSGEDLPAIERSQRERLRARLAMARSEYLSALGDGEAAAAASKTYRQITRQLAEQEKVGTGQGEFPAAMQNLVDALIEQASPTEAELAQASAWLAEMRRKHPPVSGMAEWLGRSAIVHWRRGKQELALRAAEQALSLQPENPEVQLIALVLKGKAEAASFSETHLNQAPGDRRFRRLADIAGL